MAKAPSINTIHGDAGDNILVGTAGNDSIQGREGNDQLFGGAGNDSLYGQEGDDLIDGGAGDDTIGFGPGSDFATGGSGADRFVFAGWEWTNQLPWIHTIADFQSGIDKIDLSRLNANESTVPGIIRGNKTPGNEPFQFVNTTDGVTPGHLDISYGTDAQGRAITIVSGYTDTTAGADIVIHLLGTLNPTAGDFVL